MEKKRVEDNALPGKIVSNCSLQRHQGKVPPGSCEVHTRNLEFSLGLLAHINLSLRFAPSDFAL